jgi:hypothetical protein
MGTKPTNGRTLADPEFGNLSMAQPSAHLWIAELLGYALELFDGYRKFR